MNKKLITLAVAAAMTAPAAALADATLYGKLNVSIDYFDVDNGFEGWALNGGTGLPGESRANRVGVKGSEDLGGGLKAIYQVEFYVPLANERDYNLNNGDIGKVAMRNSFVGLAGDWGTFLVGRHDTPYKIAMAKLDLFADTIADFNGTVGFQDIRADNAIAYISPSFSGFQFAGAIIPGGGSTAGLGVYGQGVQNSVRDAYGLTPNDPVVLETGIYNEDSDSIAQAWSLAAIYSNGPFYGSVGYEVLSKEMLAFQATGDFDPTIVGDETFFFQPDDDLEKWSIGLGLMDWNGFTLDGRYAWQDFGDASDDLWQIQAAYAFGNNTFKGMYGQGDLDLGIDGVDDVKHDTWALGFDHNFSKRTRAYLVYTDVDYDDTDVGDWEGFSLGMVHQF